MEVNVKLHLADCCSFWGYLRTFWLTWTAEPNMQTAVKPRNADQAGPQGWEERGPRSQSNERYVDI